MILNVTMKDHNYDVVIERNSLDNIESYLDLNRNVLIVTDDGIPQSYVNKVLSKCNNGFVYTIEGNTNNTVAKRYYKLNYSKITGYNPSMGRSCIFKKNNITRFRGIIFFMFKKFLIFKPVHSH